MREKRLESDPELNAKYRHAIDDDLQKEYIKKLPEHEFSQANPRVWYLSHHPVLNPHKPVKVRRVSDAAANYQGTSLNDQFSSGPHLLNSLVSILMRFRQESIAMSDDIEAMFNQVAVPEEDQSVLRFVWRRTPEDKVDVYQYLRHIFCAKCSPTCSNEQLKIIRITFPLEAEVVERNFYMDDLLKSVPSLLEACSLQAGLVNLLSLVGFRLTKWVSNDKDLLSAIPAELRAQSVRTIGEQSILPTERALGVIWDVQKDAFLFKIKPKELADTRRKVINLTASIFDPIGFLAPFTIHCPGKDISSIAVEISSRLGRGDSERNPARVLSLAEGTSESSRILGTAVLSPGCGFSHFHLAVLVW